MCGQKRLKESLNGNLLEVPYSQSSSDIHSSRESEKEMKGKYTESSVNLFQDDSRVSRSNHTEKVCAICGKEIKDYPGEFENGKVPMIFKERKVVISFDPSLCADCAEEASLEISGWIRFGSCHVSKEIRQKTRIDHWMKENKPASFSEWKKFQAKLKKEELEEK